MNDWDRDNLNYILSCNWEQFEEFMDSLYELDDLQYAIRLIQTGLAELKVAEMEWEETEEITDFSEAEAVISKLKG